MFISEIQEFQSQLLWAVARLKDLLIEYELLIGLGFKRFPLLFFHYYSIILKIGKTLLRITTNLWLVLCICQECKIHLKIHSRLNRSVCLLERLSCFVCVSFVCLLFGARALCASAYTYLVFVHVCIAAVSECVPLSQVFPSSMVPAAPAVSMAFTPAKVSSLQPPVTEHLRMPRAEGYFTFITCPFCHSSPFYDSS